jgi:SulP family sulfate permease
MFLSALTLSLTVLADLTVAIGVGVALGLAFRLQRRGDNGPGWSDPDR